MQNLIPSKQKTQTLFACSSCDAQYPKWLGQCQQCGKWGTIRQETVSAKDPEIASVTVPEGNMVQLEDVANNPLPRLGTRIGEFDRVLGGGIVPGSVILLGGDPGIGKSTLLLQTAVNVSEGVLYVSAEESVGQVNMRLKRLGGSGKHIAFLGDNQVEVIIKTLQTHRPKLVIIDSIQTVVSLETEGAAGSVTQVKISTGKFIATAKELNIPIILVGHVTKEGSLAGPKMLEHMVDTVLYLEGDTQYLYRILRSVKNRFGSLSEIGVFDMEDKGLIEVKNPSALFLEGRFVGASGSIITPIVEGSRSFLVEVQALVNKTVFGYPLRKASGFDSNRLQVLLAVLGKRAKVNFDQFDVHINIVGGLKLKEPSSDLAVCLALVSAHKNIPLPENLIACGEIGLAGEVRSIVKMKERLEEAKRLGIQQACVPFEKKKRDVQGMKIMTVRHITDAIANFLEK